jgi:mersacidin/lichenicidin family type 2 lantibiotic
MNTEQIVRSWKDDEYLLALSDQEQALLPDSPVGMAELSDDELLGVAGGTETALVCAVIATFVLSASLGAAYSIYLVATSKKDL